MIDFNNGNVAPQPLYQCGNEAVGVVEPGQFKERGTRDQFQAAAGVWYAVMEKRITNAVSKP